MTAPGNPDTSPSSVTGRPGRELARPPRYDCTCGDEVLELHAPDVVIVDVDELVPLQKCPTCRGRGATGPRHVQQPCGRCHGTKIIGEPLPEHDALVALDPYGNARWTLLADRGRGDALHRPHVCAPVSG